MRQTLLVVLVAALGSYALAPAGLGQTMRLSDYLREGGFTPRRGLEGIPGKLGNLIRDAVAASQDRQYDKAISLYTAVLQMNPESNIEAGVYEERARAYIEKKEFKKAVADASEAIRLDRRFSEAYNVRGVAYGNAGDMIKALDDFEMAIRLDPKSTWARRNREIAQGMKKIGVQLGMLIACLHAKTKR